MKPTLDKPQRPFIAGFWLVVTIPLAVLVAYPLNTFVRPGSIVKIVGFLLLAVIFLAHPTCGQKHWGKVAA